MHEVQILFPRGSDPAHTVCEGVAHRTREVDARFWLTLRRASAEDCWKIINVELYSLDLWMNSCQIEPIDIMPAVGVNNPVWYEYVRGREFLDLNGKDIERAADSEFDADIDSNLPKRNRT